MAAGPIFARKGFKNATVRQICDAANVNLASINYYFGDKQNLYTETVLRTREMRAQQFPQKPWVPGQSPEQKLGHIILTLLQRLVALQTEPWQVRLIMREVLQPTEASRKLMKESFRPFFDSLLSVIDELIGIRLPDAQRHKIGLSIIGQCMHYRFSAEMISMMIEENEFEEHFQLDQIATHITEFSLGAIDRLRAHAESENQPSAAEKN